MARWVIADDREEDAESTSEEEEESEAEEEEAEGSEEAEAVAEAEEEPAAAGPSSAAAAPSPGGTIKQRKLSIKLGGPDVCHVSAQHYPWPWETHLFPSCASAAVQGV